MGHQREQIDYSLGCYFFRAHLQSAFFINFAMDHLNVHNAHTKIEKVYQIQI